MGLTEYPTALFAVVGAVVGTALSILGLYSAEAAVAVRPNLAEVGFVTAALTAHGFDWLFYHHPLPTAVAVILLASLFGAAVWRFS